VLICVFALKRLKNNSAPRRISVVILNIIASFSLLALIFGVSYQTNDSLQIALVTPNADKQAIKILMSEDKPLHWVFLNTLGDKSIETLLDNEGQEAKRIESIAQLTLYYPHISQLTLLGDGLSHEEWALLNAQYANVDESSKPVIQIEAYMPKLGLVDMRWPAQLVSGQSGRISGRIQTRTESPDSLYRLRLIDPFNQEIDSVLLSANEAFSFAINTSVVGQWKYTLSLSERSQPSLEIEQRVAIQVINAPPVKMIIKQSSPSFESKHIQTLVSEAGGRVLTLTKISKNKAIRQGINLSSTDKTLLNEPFSEKALGFFDLLIIDQLALRELSEAQDDALALAIKNGLGVLVLPRPEQLTEWVNDKRDWLRDIRLTTNTSETQPAQYFRWDQQQLDIPLSSINANILAPNASPIVLAQNNRPLVVTQGYGQGKVAVSLINTSYTLKTQGQVELYSHFWQWLFSQISRNNNDLHWKTDDITSPITARTARTAQQACVLNAVENTQFNFKQGSVSSTNIANKQLLDASSFCVKYTPQTTGWFTLTASSDQSTSASIAYFAYDQSKWLTWQQSIRHNATQKNKANYPDTAVQPIARTLFIEATVFWAILLVALTILWIERKLNTV
jgi:hypothetical protein